MGIFSKFKKNQHTVNGVKINRRTGYQSAGISLNEINSTSIYLNTIYSRLTTDIAKLNLRHIKTHKTDDATINEPQSNSDIMYVLTISPNRFDTPTIFWNEVILDFLRDGLAVVLPVYKNGQLRELIHLSEYEIDAENNTLIYNNQVYDFSEVLLFQDINTELHENLQDIARVINEALNAMSTKLTKGNSSIYGFLKLNTNTDDLEMMKKVRDRLANISQVASQEGIGYLQKGEEYQELKTKIETASVDHLKFLKEQLQNNYGLNDKIIQSNYTEEQYKAYIQNVISPYQEMIVQELNKKLFTRTAITQGHKIINPVRIMNFASTTDVAQALSRLKYIGMISANEGRELLGYQSYSGGDRYETNANAVRVLSTEEERERQQIQSNPEDFKKFMEMYKAFELYQSEKGGEIYENENSQD